MRISRQRSGNAALRVSNENQGRGEYEWAELLSTDPAREELVDRNILLRISGDILLDTGCELCKEDGKWRLRIGSDARAKRFMYPPYHVAVALLMPCPTRNYPNIGVGLPILRSEQYFVDDLYAGAVSLIPESCVDIAVDSIRISNNSVPNGTEIQVAERLALVMKVWHEQSQLPVELSELIGEHERLVRGGDQISILGLPLLAKIQASAAEASQELNAVWATQLTDPLPVLLELIGHTEMSFPPIPIQEIAPEHLDIRRREVARQRGMANIRGPESNRFRRDVRKAYGSICIICGLKLPKFWKDGRSGMDAAHILPDSEFELNHPSNGLCLCKLHHWAFDEGLVEVTFDGSGYSITISEEVEARALELGYDLEFVRQYTGLIPDARLPENTSYRPNPECLKRLRELLHP